MRPTKTQLWTILTLIDPYLVRNSKLSGPFPNLRHHISKTNTSPPKTTNELGKQKLQISNSSQMGKASSRGNSVGPQCLQEYGEESQMKVKREILRAVQNWVMLAKAGMSSATERWVRQLQLNSSWTFAKSTSSRHLSSWRYPVRRKVGG